MKIILGTEEQKVFLISGKEKLILKAVDFL